MQYDTFYPGGGVRGVKNGVVGRAVGWHARLPEFNSG